MRWLALALWLLIPAVAHAHGSVSERIAALDAELASHPNDAARIAKRAALHALEGRWTDAVGDFEDAYELDPSIAGIEHDLANALLHVGEPERAIALLTRLLVREPRHVDAHIVRARAYLAVGESQKAIDDYSAALGDAPVPRYYRERAQAIAESGASDAAVASLREGIAKLGPIVSLVELAVDLEEERGRHREALALVDELPEKLRRSPEWRARRAALLRRLGMLEQAAAEYREALTTIDALVPARRHSAAMTALRARIESELVAVVPPSVAPPPAHGVWMALFLVAGVVVLVRQRFRG